MLTLLRHLLDPSYLYALQQQPLGDWPAGTLWWAAALAGIGATVWWRQRLAPAEMRMSWAIGIALASSALGLTWLALRPWVTGPLSARIWPYGLTVLAACAALTDSVQRRLSLRPAGPAWRVLGLCQRPDQARLTRIRAWGHLAAHLIGLYWLSLRWPSSSWLGAVAIAVLGLIWLIEKLVTVSDRPPLRLELLAPLYPAYAASLLGWLIQDALAVRVGAYAAFQYPDLWSPWFNGETMALLTAIWVALATVSFAGYVLADRWPRLRGRALVALAPCGAVSWYLLVMLKHLSAGATASDPYCYLQMASDLVRTGSALHDFPLAEMARQAGLPTWPLVHVGYHPPIAGTLAPTVWPIGWPVMLAPLVWLGGEQLAMWGAPLCALASAIIVWRITRHLWPGEHARLIGGLAAAITLTSLEGTLRSLVPMADAAAQLCAIAMLYALIRGREKRAVLWDALAGLALGLAYWVRHPLLWLGAGTLAWYAPMLKSRRGWLKASAFGVAALLAALPDLVYHAQHFGAIWHTESPEWFLISWANIPPTFAAMVRNGLLGRSELGYLWPAIALGTWTHVRARRQRTTLWLMLVALLATLVFALCYSALRWRDLIALLPLFSLWAAMGLVTAWRSVAASSARQRAVMLGMLLLLLSARGTLPHKLPLNNSVWTFGAMSPVQRVAFDQLAAHLPDNAIVATGLNSGAVERYAGRSTVRPSTWTGAQFAAFRQATDEQGLALYILDDGEEMALWLDQEALIPDLVPVCSLDLPTFGLGGQPLDIPARLYRFVHPN